MTDFKQIIKIAKPNLKDVSIQRYASNLSKLCKDLNSNDNITLLINVDKIMSYLDTKTPSTKKAYLNAIIVVLKAKLPKEEVIKIYQKKRDSLNKDYFNEKSTNLKNDKEDNNMITFKEWDNLIRELDIKISAQGLRKKTVLNKNEFTLMLQYLLVSLYRNYPLRNDFAIMKIYTQSEYNKDNDKQYNYFINKNKGCQFILNNYKTNKTYGTIIMNVDKDTCKIIRQFLKISPNKKMLIVDHAGNPLSRNRLSKFLITTFQNYLKKPIGSQMLRKSYVSSKYGDVLDDMKDDANVMGHSIGTQQKVYIKTN